MDTIQNLLALYAGLLLINSVLAFALWVTTRERLYRTVFFVWGSTVVSFVLQGVLAWNALVITIGFSSVFLVNLALAHLLATSLDLRLGWRPYAAFLAGALLLSTGLHLTGADFTAVALPTCVAVSLPLLATVIRVLRRGAALSISMKALLAASVLFSLHNLDFAFLRDVPEMAPLGFTVATLIIFLLSVTAPAVALERVTAERSRIATEMETTRRIQTRLLPGDHRLGAFDLVTHVRSADQVGGDYFDAYQLGDDCWLMLGDVTGHGIGAGMVMLMAQSTISAILQTRPDISPRELNFQANRVLARNLARLGEERHMTVVSIRSDADGLLTISGSHDNIYVMRAATGAVETLELSHFPIGIGFLATLGPEQFREEAIQLEPGDLLFIGSDGVTEAAREGDYRKGVFGEDALIEVLGASADASLEEVRATLLERLEAFTGGVYHDDVSFLILRAAARPAHVVAA